MNLRSLALAALAFASACVAANSGRLTVTWLELPVHGLAVVVETPAGRVFLIDAGGTKSGAPGHDSGRDTIAPFLAKRGHREIAGLVVSHAHGDHYGGAGWLLENIPVREFLDNGYEGRGLSDEYRAIRANARRRAGTYRVASAGARLDWDPALEVEVLSPPAAFLGTTADPAKLSEHGLLNQNSLVLRVQHGRNVFIFPGDCYGGTFEKHLATLPPEKLRATVLTAPHHGFNPGYEFPKLTRPGIVVTSCLADYPANAPTPYPRSPGANAHRVFSALGAKVFVTAWHGHVQAVSDGDAVVMTVERESAPQPEPPKTSPPAATAKK